MKTLRSATLGAAAILVGGGYAASQWFYWTGRASVYAKAVDAMPVQTLATVLLVASIVLWLVPGAAEGERP